MAGKSFCVELMIDVDSYDNYTVAKHWYNIDVYGPEQIAEFFKKCKENNIKTVYWRSHCQVAAYRSRVNYNIGETWSIKSFPDSIDFVESGLPNISTHPLGLISFHASAKSEITP